MQIGQKENFTKINSQLPCCHFDCLYNAKFLLMPSNLQKLQKLSFTNILCSMVHCWLASSLTLYMCGSTMFCKLVSLLSTYISIPSFSLYSSFFLSYLHTLPDFSHLSHVSRRASMVHTSSGGQPKCTALFKLLEESLAKVSTMEKFCTLYISNRNNNVLLSADFSENLDLTFNKGQQASNLHTLMTTLV